MELHSVLHVHLLLRFKASYDFMHFSKLLELHFVEKSNKKQIYLKKKKCEQNKQYVIKH